MIGDILHSFRAMPLWVQVWVALVLVPVNVASLLFLDAPNGVTIAVLANGALWLNGGIMLYERGLSRLMALPHLLLWTPLVMILAVTLSKGIAGEAVAFFWALLVINLISLGFDYVDFWKWLQGQREVAGR